MNRRWWFAPSGSRMRMSVVPGVPAAGSCSAAGAASATGQLSTATGQPSLPGPGTASHTSRTSPACEAGSVPRSGLPWPYHAVGCQARSEGKAVRGCLSAGQGEGHLPLAGLPPSLPCASAAPPLPLPCAAPPTRAPPCSAVQCSAPSSAVFSPQTLKRHVLQSAAQPASRRPARCSCSPRFCYQTCHQSLPTCLAAHIKKSYCCFLSFAAMISPGP